MSERDAGYVQALRDLRQHFHKEMGEPHVPRHRIDELHRVIEHIDGQLKTRVPPPESPASSGVPGNDDAAASAQ